MDIVLEFLHQIYLERWDVLMLIITIIHRKEIAVALRGGNGVMQMDEFAKGVILFVFYASFRYEATRQDLTHQVFSDAYWFAVLGTVTIIAGLKGVNAFFPKKEDKPPAP